MKLFDHLLTYFTFTIGSAGIGASIFVICRHFGFGGEEAWHAAALAGFGVGSNMLALSFMIENSLKS